MKVQSKRREEWHITTGPIEVRSEETKAEAIRRVVQSHPNVKAISDNPTEAAQLEVAVQCAIMQSTTLADGLFQLTLAGRIPAGPGEPLPTGGVREHLHVDVYRVNPVKKV